LLCFRTSFQKENARRNLEAVLVRMPGQLVVVVASEALFVFLFPDVAQTLEEQEAEDVVLVVRAVDLAAQGCPRRPTDATPAAAA
jgi:hypothetical protein